MFSSERLKGIDLFVCVADLGSFTAAAERMSLTSSAVSKGIARLETRLRIRLFERSTRHMTLTEAGRAFYATCAQVLAQLEESEAALHAEDGEPQGRIRIDLPAAYGRMHALPVVLKFVERYPLVSPHISFADRFVDPIAEEIDVLVRIGGSDLWPASLGHHFLGVQRHVFCASPAYLRTYGEPEIAQDLDQHRCIVYGPVGSLMHAWYFAGEKTHDVQRKVISGRVAVGDGEGQRIAALAGHGIAQLPAWLIKQELASGTLVEVLPGCATDGLPMNIVWPKRRESARKVSALIEMLARYLTPSGHLLEEQR